MKQKLAILAVVVAVAALGCWKAMAGNNPHIVNLDLSIEGVADGKEFLEPPPSATPNGPGGYVCTCANGWKKITLAATGVDPRKTRLNWNSSKIAVWTAQSGGMAIPNPKLWDPASGMYPELWVQGVAVSSTRPTKDASGNWTSCGAEHMTLEAINNGEDPSTPGTYYDRVAFTVIDVRTHNINANRVSIPAEDPFPVKAEEHFEVRGSFKFKLDPEISPAPPCIRYEVWDTDGWDDLITSGAGAEFTYTWDYGVDEGDAFVRFYCDSSGNGQYDSGEAERKTPEFWVQTRKWYDFKVQYSDQLGSVGSQIQSVLNNAELLVIRKDSADDYRACVSFNASPVPSVFVSGPARPDPLTWNDYTNSMLHLTQADIIMLNQLDGAAGVCWGYVGTGWMDIILDWDYRSGNALAHEIGHGVGITGDYSDNPSDIMYFQVWVPPGKELRKADADKYD